jgi:hypothetical protein
MSIGFRMAAPLICFTVADLIYFVLNIRLRWFVDYLGCGCAPGFNTNSLTGILGTTFMVGAAAACWSAPRGLSMRWRVSYLACSWAFLAWLTLRFLYYNWWA